MYQLQYITTFYIIKDDQKILFDAKS